MTTKNGSQSLAAVSVIEGWRLLLPYRSDWNTVIAGSVSNVPTVFFTYEYLDIGIIVHALGPILAIGFYRIVVRLITCRREEDVVFFILIIDHIARYRIQYPY